ncbi:hypothetical protein C7212DRAFT_220841 [Tuber magnatum]|uniref:Uncharacterized protein n=1 Tax=Tuber magnatum TaxID=42249 RepID=A0A317SJZ9_9PEZI|nr:hypothetical protein C7212DRAFT_220841 [Tuber magnatum]
MALWRVLSRDLSPPWGSRGGSISGAERESSESNSVSTGRGVLTARERAGETPSGQGSASWRGALRPGVDSVIIGVASAVEVGSWIAWGWFCRYAVLASSGSLPESISCLSSEH